MSICRLTSRFQLVAVLATVALTACTDYQVNRLADAIEKGADRLSGPAAVSPSAAPSIRPATLPQRPVFLLGPPVTSGAISVQIPNGWERLRVAPCPVATLQLAFGMFTSESLEPEAELTVESGNQPDSKVTCLYVQEGSKRLQLVPEAPTAVPTGFVRYDRFRSHREDKPYGLLHVFQGGTAEPVILSIHHRDHVLTDEQVVAIARTLKAP